MKPHPLKPSCLLPLASCLLPLAYCLLPLASCLHRKIATHPHQLSTTTSLSTG
ncbi:MAG: hypothetical protein F6K55_03555 [Moorea sp. SIO4A3]|nr:hypothetical protein [Moorena sp. SIO4A3]